MRNCKASSSEPGRMAVIAFGIVIAVSAINPRSLLAAPVITQWEVAATHAGAGEIFSPISYSYVEPRDVNVTKLRATTSEQLDPNTVNSSVASIHALQTGDISSMVADVNLDPGRTQITITLTDPLASGDSYSIKLASTIQSVGGEPLSGNRTVGITPLFADVDSSGSIDLVDLIGVRNHLGGVNSANARYDLDASGTIDSNDLVIARASLDEAASVPDYVSVSPYKAWIPDINESRQLLVTVHCTTGEVYDFTASVKGTIYETSDSNVATVSIEGLITPLADGEATVTGAIFGLLDTCNTRVITTPAVATDESGWIDGIVYDSNTDTPLQDAIIVVDGVSGRGLSDPNGKFAFPTPGSGLFFTTIYKDGYTYHQRRVEVTRTLDSAVYSAYLLPQAEPLLPAGSGMMSMAGDSLDSPLDSTQTGQVYTNQSGTIQMVFPAGSRFAKAAVAARKMTLAEGENPSLTVPQITATQVTRSIELPDALPEQSEFTYAFFFDVDGEDELPELVTIRFANTLGFAPGTEIPVGRWDDKLLKWVHEAVAVVTPDGQWVEYQARRFSAKDINLPPLPPPQAGSPDPEDPGNEDQSEPEDNDEGGEPCTGNGDNSFVAARTGELFEEHSLPSYRSLGADRSPVRLVYQSRAAKPSAFIAYDLDLNTMTTLVPEAHGFRVSIEGRLYESWMQGTAGSHRHAFVWDGFNDRGELLPTGCYFYHLRMTNEYRSNLATSSTGLFAGPPGQDLGVEAPERVQYPASTSGTVVLRNERSSPFGAGWTVAGLQRLIINPAQTRATLIQGDGSAVTFKAGLDIAVFGDTFVSYDIFVGLGNGDGTFQTGETFFAIDGIRTEYSFVTGDFNGDTKLDLVHDDSRMKLVHTHLGNGDGTFQSPLPSPSPTGGYPIPYKFVVGDFDNDGHKDLASANRMQKSVSVFLGNGDGTFAPNQQFAAGVSPRSIVTADLNGDGRQDIATANQEDNVSVFLGNGDGTLQDQSQYAVGDFPSGLAAGDFNGDGHADLVTANANSYDLSVLLGNGDGTFQPEQRVGSGLEYFPNIPDPAVADLDNNGYLDLVVAISKSGVYEVLVLLGNGDGTFQPEQRYETLPPQQTKVADFDGDGFLDVVTLCYWNFVSVLLGNGDGTLQEQKLSEIGFVQDGAIVVGDFDKTNGMFVSPPSEYSQLRRNSNSTYTRKMKDGTVHHFDPNGFITDTIDRNGNITTYEYIEDVNNKKIWKIIDPTRMVTVFDYDGDKLISMTDPTGRITQFEINDSNDLVRITNPDGTYRSFEYNSDHLLTAQVDANGTRTEYVYDNYGCVTEVIKAVVTADEQHRYFQASVNQGLINDLPPGVGTRNNPAPVVRPEDIRESYTNGEGEAEYYYTNRFGSRTIIEDPCGRTIQMERDSFNQVSQITYPKGNQISYEYDKKGNLTKITNHGITPSSVTLIEYDPTWNRPTRIEDPNHHITTLAYDPCNGNLLSITDPMTYTTTFTYNEYGQVETITNAEGEAVQLVYYEPNDPNDPNDPNIARNLRRIIVDPNGLNLTTTLEYDLNGNISKITDANDNSTNYVYDVMNLLRFVTDAENHTTEYRYEPALGTISQWSSVPLAELTKIIDARSIDTATFSYDKLHRLKTETNVLSKSHQYAYDNADRLISATDANGQTITYIYDDTGQLITKTLPTSGGPEEVVYEYDLNGNLTRIADNDSNLLFGYDNADRLVSYTSAAVAGQPALSLTYNYDADGTLLTMTDPTGSTFHTYNANRWLTQIADPASRVTNFVYDQVGRRTNKTNHNATEVSYTYDVAGRLTDLIHDLSAVPFLSFTYTHDSTGNILTMTDNEGTHTYGYDAIYQLTSAAHPNAVVNPTESFSYDALGNRLSSHLSSSYSHNNANQLLEDDDYTYTYDDNGNLAAKTAKVGGAVTTYTYDAENRLIRVDLPGGLWAEYRYDALSRRIEKDVNGTITRYTYSGEDILFEYDSSNNILARYTHGFGIDEPLIMDRGGQSYYYHADRLGSIRNVTNATGSVVQTSMYDSFGQIMTQTGATPNPYTYTAREWDSESSLYYYRTRHYNPGIGRFLQTDPIGTAGGINLYSYVANNPANWLDPYGLCKEDEDWLKDFLEKLAGELDPTPVSEAMSIAEKMAEAANEQYEKENPEDWLDEMLKDGTPWAGNKALGATARTVGAAAKAGIKAKFGF